MRAFTEGECSVILLQTVIDGGAIDRERIRTIAAVVAPSCGVREGRR